MTDVELSALEAAAKATTPGPWRTEGYSILRNSDGIASAQSNGSPEICNVLLDGDYDPKTRHERALHNAAYIAAANPAAVLDLIAELRQARAERDWIARKYTDAFNMLGRHDRMTFIKAISIAKESTCQKN